MLNIAHLVAAPEPNIAPTKTFFQKKNLFFFQPQLFAMPPRVAELFGHSFPAGLGDFHAGHRPHLLGCFFGPSAPSAGGGLGCYVTVCSFSFLFWWLLKASKPVQVLKMSFLGEKVCPKPRDIMDVSAFQPRSKSVCLTGGVFSLLLKVC